MSTVDNRDSVIPGGQSNVEKSTIPLKHSPQKSTSKSVEMATQAKAKEVLSTEKEKADLITFKASLPFLKKKLGLAQTETEETLSKKIKQTSDRIEKYAFFGKLFSGTIKQEKTKLRELELLKANLQGIENSAKAIDRRMVEIEVKSALEAHKKVNTPESRQQLFTSLTKLSQIPGADKSAGQVMADSVDHLLSQKGVDKTPVYQFLRSLPENVREGVITKLVNTEETSKVTKEVLEPLLTKFLKKNSR